MEFGDKKNGMGWIYEIEVLPVTNRRTECSDTKNL